MQDPRRTAPRARRNANPKLLVLAAVDLSAGSTEVVERALELAAQQADGEVHVITVVDLDIPVSYPVAMPAAHRQKTGDGAIHADECSRGRWSRKFCESASRFESSDRIDRTARSCIEGSPAASAERTCSAVGSEGSPFSSRTHPARSAGSSAP